MQVRWTTPALNHLDAIQDYVAQENPVAAYALTTDILDRTDTLLSAMPHSGRAGRVVGTYEWVIPDTSYIAVYRITDYVEILAVMHTARKWPERF